MLVEVYGDTAPTDNHIGNGFEDGRQASLWTAKKIRRQRIRGITRRRQSQTQEELAESLGITQQVVFVRLRTMGMIQKQGIGCLMN